ncbi:hypothetical protein H696_02506 [Fonticula alba]|uniref:Cyclin N-terminal domain-containing protein n=1 Tax=Fonticula alba TaxID=691883 RepID=A0A058ZC92_FONAL|nr:hypothetical protein H696_02506 [Fonticula alba]KCV71566.1 hypothetical protein H696_02506 [Fonticula alba]|eukprot:XP_009494689.1 hypothetical protein H696_02506 [Fonticula alba]
MPPENYMPGSGSVVGEAPARGSFHTHTPSELAMHESSEGLAMIPTSGHLNEEGWMQPAPSSRRSSKQFLQEEDFYTVATSDAAGSATDFGQHPGDGAPPRPVTSPDFLTHRPPRPPMSFIGSGPAAQEPHMQAVVRPATAPSPAWLSLHHLQADPTRGPAGVISGGRVPEAELGELAPEAGSLISPVSTLVNEFGSEPVTSSMSGPGIRRPMHEHMDTPFQQASKASGVYQQPGHHDAHAQDIDIDIDDDDHDDDDHDEDVRSEFGYGDEEADYSDGDAACEDSYPGHGRAPVAGYPLPGVVALPPYVPIDVMPDSEMHVEPRHEQEEYAAPGPGSMSSDAQLQSMPVSVPLADGSLGAPLPPLPPAPMSAPGRVFVSSAQETMLKAPFPRRNQAPCALDTDFAKTFHPRRVDRAMSTARVAELLLNEGLLGGGLVELATYSDYDSESEDPRSLTTFEPQARPWRPHPAGVLADPRSSQGQHGSACSPDERGHIFGALGAGYPGDDAAATAPSTDGDQDFRFSPSAFTGAYLSSEHSSDACHLEEPPGGMVLQSDSPAGMDGAPRPLAEALAGRTVGPALPTYGNTHFGHPVLDRAAETATFVHHMLRQEARTLPFLNTWWAVAEGPAASDCSERHPEIRASDRGVVANWLTEVDLLVPGSPPQVLGLAMNLWDRYLSMVQNIPKHSAQMIALTCYFLAIKFEDSNTEWTISRVMQMTGEIFCRSSLHLTERMILAALNYDLAHPPATSFIRRLALYNPTNASPPPTDEPTYDKQVYHVASYVAEVVLCFGHTHPVFANVRPSVLACCAVVLARLMLKRSPPEETPGVPTLDAIPPVGWCDWNGHWPWSIARSVVAVYGRRQLNRAFRNTAAQAPHSPLLAPHVIAQYHNRPLPLEYVAPYTIQALYPLLGAATQLLKQPFPAACRALYTRHAKDHNLRASTYVHKSMKTFLLPGLQPRRDGW